VVFRVGMERTPSPWRTDPQLRQLLVLGVIATLLAVLSVCVVAFA
jgi:hypothetical protein